MKLLTLLLMVLLSGMVGCSSKLKMKPGHQTSQKLLKEIKKTIGVQYLLYLPDEYDTANKSWPLILFLHGAGERGNDVNKVKFHGPPKLVEKGEKFPFIIVSPQCPADQWWSIEVLDLLLKDIVNHYKVDEDRIYLTGLSMGGFGSWALALDFPDRFAAIAPICGGGKPEMVDRIRHLPVWVLHGAKDEVVPLKKSQDMVDALKKVDGNVKFTVYPDAYHDSWTETYNNPVLYEWFLKHSKKK